MGLKSSPTYVSGTMPTPHGSIFFSFDSRTLSGTLHFPLGQRGKVCFQGSLSSCTILVNGEAQGVGCTGYISINASLTLQACDSGLALHDGVWFSGHEREEAVKELPHSSSPSPSTTLAPPSPFIPLPPLSLYPVTVLGRDIETRGGWIGKYGSDGFSLFSFLGPSHDRTQLPPYIASVSVPSYAAGRVGSFVVNTSDPRALRSPEGGLRSLGFRATVIPDGITYIF